ncbi:MAG: hypothetical protein R3F39_10305 [Myxococcota bacterium]
MHVILSAALIALSLTAAQRLGWFYPFSPFDMFAGAHTETSHMVARTADGAEHRLDEVTGWDCGAHPQLDPTCPGAHTERDERLLSRIASEAAADGSGQPMEILRHIYRIDPLSRAMVRAECVALTCRASLRDTDGQ